MFPGSEIMTKKELLSPVGSKEALYQAVQNGCDAVYLSGKSFGARKFAPNFDREELKESVEYCHLYGVKIYVTVNTLIHDREKEELMEYVTYLYQIGVDALIMQDLGMIREIRETLPDLEIHASTQLHNHNQEDLKYLKQLGVTRAVLAREMSLEEIKAIKEEIELEVFVHGALCICYSGQCLFSSLVLNRSGNRGECAGLCRLPYTLLKNGKKVESKGDYLLSPKELNTSHNLKELLKLDEVTSLKIEGRMKSPEYVGFITRLYRNIIDSYERGQDYQITEETEKELKILYNRDFTKGHLFHETNDRLMNIKSPNHIGISLGEVIEVSKKRIKIRLTDVLYQGDGIRFSNGEGMIVNFIYNKKDLLVSKADKNEIIELDNKVGLTTLGEVRKTSSQKLLESLNIQNQRKIKIQGKLIALPNRNMRLEVTDGIHHFIKESPMIEKAKTSPTTKERIREQLEKINDTPFAWESLEIETENAFVPIKLINELRRTILEELQKFRMKSERKVKKEEIHWKLPEISSKAEISVLVRTKEQYETVKGKVDCIYVANEKLYQELNDSTCFLRTSRVTPKYFPKEKKKLLVGEPGGLFCYRNQNEVITDYFCNAYNANTVLYFLEQGSQKVTLSIELTTEEKIELMERLKKQVKILPPVETIIYGRSEVMILKHCPIAHLQKQTTGCNLCRTKDHYVLRDRNNACYPIISECPYTHILHYKKEDKIEDIPKLIESGVTSFRLELFDETKEEGEQLLLRINMNMENNK